MDSPEHIDQGIDNQERTSPILDVVQGRELLRLARSAIEEYLLHGKILDCKNNEPAIPMTTGVFVTLWRQDTIQTGRSLSEGSILRGCIGHLQSDSPIFDLVQEVAIGAATRDPRFPPLTLAEFDTISIEIALLSPLRMINDLQQVIIGQDGLMLEGLGKRGLLLPKVAARMGWDRKSFLNNVCNKAGLPLSCWPGECNLYAFTTLVFDEADI